MSECFEMATNIANRMMPLALASLRTESDVLAHLDSIGVTAEESGYQVRANVADALGKIAAQTRANAERARGAPMGRPGKDERDAAEVAARAAGWEWDEGGPHFYRTRPGASAFEPYEYAHIKSGSWLALCEAENITPKARIPIMYRLARVPLNSGGYDASGTYWGLGAPLYRFEAETGQHDGHLRARSRDLAKAEVLKLEANAIFFR